MFFLLLDLFKIFTDSENLKQFVINEHKMVYKIKNFLVLHWLNYLIKQILFSCFVQCPSSELIIFNIFADDLW